MHMNRIIAAFAVLLLSATGASAQWAGQCPAGVASTSIGCKQAAAAPALTDLVMGWQVGQSPRDRAMQVQQIINTSGSTVYFPIAGGTITGSTVFSAASTALAVTNNALIGGTLGVTGLASFAANGATASESISASRGLRLGTALTAGENARISFPTDVNLVMQPAGAGYVRVQGDFSAYHLSGRADLQAGTVWNNDVAGDGVSNLFVAGSVSGTVANGGAGSVNTFNVASDTLDCSVADGGTCAIMVINHNMGGTGHAGGRQIFKAFGTQTAAIPAGAGGTQQYVAGRFGWRSSFSSGGTDLASNAKGLWYGPSSQIVLQAGSTNNVAANISGEKNITIEAGASVRDVLGRSVVATSTHAVAGADYNVVDMIANQNSALNSWANGYTFGWPYGQWALTDTATLIGTLTAIACGDGGGLRCRILPYTAGYGVDWERVNFSVASGYAFRSSGFAVDGSGQVTAGNKLLIGNTATGAKLDIPNTFEVTSVAVAVGGTPSVGTGTSAANYYPLDIVAGTGTPSRGQYKVTNTSAISAAVNAGGSGGVNGACTVTGTTGTGTKFQFTGTVASGALSGALALSVAGNYTVNPTALEAEPVTGCSLVGATVSVGFGMLTVSTLVSDVFVACPGAGGITPVGGSGVGATLTPTCAARSTLSLQTSGGSTLIGTGATIDGDGDTLVKTIAIGNPILTLTDGALGLKKITASASAAGAAGLKIEVVCGTGAGTAKLTAIAGTSATPVTILDNIGAGVTGCP
jgi:hypothetical protein